MVMKIQNKQEIKTSFRSSKDAYRLIQTNGRTKGYNKSVNQLHGSSQPFGPSLLRKSMMTCTASSTLLEREWFPYSISTLSAPPIALHNLHQTTYQNIFISHRFYAQQMRERERKRDLSTKATLSTYSGTYSSAMEKITCK